MRAIAALLRTDLRQLLRSRRALVVAVFLPIAVWPATLLMSQKAAAGQQKRMQETVYYWAATGPEAESMRALVTAAR